MASTYSKQAKGWNIPAPNPQITMKQDLKMFVDNVNLFIGKPNNTTETTFIEAAQHDVDQWHGILQATGGELNTKKCFWTNFELQFNAKGNPSHCPSQLQDPKLYLTKQDGNKEELCNAPSNEGICHLGVHISMDRNQKAEEKVLYKCCRLFQRVYQTCLMTRYKAHVTYKTIFLPTITYPFLATYPCTLPGKSSINDNANYPKYHGVQQEYAQSSCLHSLFACMADSVFTTSQPNKDYRKYFRQSNISMCKPP